MSTELQKIEEVVQEQQTAYTPMVKKWGRKQSLRSKADEDEASSALKFTKQSLKELERERKTITDPLNKVIKHVNAKARPVKKELETLEGRLKSLLLDRQRRLREKELARAEKQAAKAETAGQLELAHDIKKEAVGKEVLSTQGFSTRTRYRAAVTDFSKLPDEYKVVDQKKLDALARAEKDGFKVKGAELVVEEVAVQEV